MCCIVTKNDNASVMFGMSILQIEFCAWLKFSLMVCNYHAFTVFYKPSKRQPKGKAHIRKSTIMLTVKLEIFIFVIG
jgi:hypothetical protein